MPNFTRSAIKKSFIKLLDEKPLRKITVKDIVAECGVNRNSFYYHFDDIPSLIEEIITENAERIISEYPAIDSIRDILYAVTDFASENKRLVLHIYDSVNRDVFEHYLWKVCDYVLNTYAQTVFEDRQISDFDKDVIIRFYKCECFGIVIEWLEHKMVNDVDKYIERFCELHSGMAEEMINRCEKGS